MLITILTGCPTYGGKGKWNLSFKKEDITIGKNGSKLIFTKTKNKKPREAYLPNLLAKKLLNNKCKPKANSTITLPHPRISLNVVLKTISKDLGWTRIVTPHTLRRTFTLRLLERGYQLNHLQVLLGHKNLATTNAYTKVRSPINPLKYLLED